MPSYTFPRRTKKRLSKFLNYQLKDIVETFGVHLDRGLGDRTECFNSKLAVLIKNMADTIAAYARQNDIDVDYNEQKFNTALEKIIDRNIAEDSDSGSDSDSDNNSDSGSDEE